MELGLTFDDVLILPRESAVLPSEVDLGSHLVDTLKLNIPIMSSPMDTVTEHKMAIAMALCGGIGVIHKNMSLEAQVKEVSAVKRYLRWIIDNPLTLTPDMHLDYAIDLMSANNCSGAPVVEGRKLVGVLTNRDVRFAQGRCLVSEIMSKDKLITAPPTISPQEALIMLGNHRVERLIIVDDEYNCVGVVTIKDLHRYDRYPLSARDQDNQLVVAAAVGVNETTDIERVEALRKAGVDAVVVDTAHGHSKRVYNMVKKIKHKYPDLPVIAGNIATADAAKYLIEAGADAVKVGIGPGSICTTRIVAGVGCPQLSAIMTVAKACKGSGVKVIADGGMRNSGDIAKAIAAGADLVMLGSMLAGSQESPGTVVVYKGRSYKAYRGMGSLGAMAAGSSDRYGQDKVTKMVAEGVEGIVPFKGKVADVLAKITGGLRSSLGYTGSCNIAEMQINCEFVRITTAGLYESHTHNVRVTQEEPTGDDGVF